ncbi:MAG: HAD family phosphatase [Acidobacteriota bacterium]|nr:HAD family phosphatase [Acidobacteriota bacterium]
MTRNKPRALIFDMDGVIVNSNPVHREAWRVYNLRHGIETDEAMQQRMFGKHNAEIVRDFYGDHLSAAEIFQHGAAKEQLYREMMHGSVEQALVPGVREFIEKHREVPAAVATNAEPENVHFVLRAAAIGHLFRAVVDGHQVRFPKPHPEIYLRAASLLDVEPAACVVFEDSVWGIEAARAAGMRVIGLRTTHRELSGVELAIDDFLSPELEVWFG